MTSVGNPALFLIAIAVGLGRLVHLVESMSDLDFLAPAMLGAASMHNGMPASRRSRSAWPASGVVQAGGHAAPPVLGHLAAVGHVGAMGVAALWLADRRLSRVMIT